MAYLEIGKVSTEERASIDTDRWLARQIRARAFTAT